MENTGFYCEKCKIVPLIQIVPKEKDIKIFCMCKCHKILISYDLFMKKYFKTDLNYSKISNEPIYKEYIDPSPRYNNKIEIDLNKINTDFNYIINKISEYTLEIKDKIIKMLKDKISEIEKLYEQNKLNNIKLQEIIKILISNYKSNDKNNSNIKNLFYNKSFNMGYRNETYSTLNFNNKSNSYIGLESLIKNASNYLKKNYILSSFNEQLYTINTFFNHLKEVTCVTEVGPEIIASSSKDSYIILYNLERKKCIYKYNAHKDEVNWLIKLNNNLISCGSDCRIKVWPKIDKKNLELVNSENNGTTNVEIININPISSFNIKESILKIILIDNNYICGCSLKNVYLIKYEIIKDNKYEDNINNDKESNEKDILKINFNLIETISYDKVFDLLKIVNKKNENIIVANGWSKIYFLSMPDLNLIREIKNINEEKPLNCLIQLNKDKLLISCRYYLRIIDINKFQIKLTVKCPGVTFLSKLRDNTIIIGTKEGIKRIYPKNFEEISLINKIYSVNNYLTTPEIFHYVYEFSDGRMAICSSHGNIRMTKFKLG